MATTMVVQLRPKDFDQFLAWSKEKLPETLAFDGCEWITYHRDEEDASRLVLLERWASREHQARYVELRTRQGVMEEMFSLLAEPLTVQWLTDVEA